MYAKTKLILVEFPNRIHTFIKYY